MLETAVIALVGLALMLMVVLSFPTLFDIAWRLIQGHTPKEIVEDIVAKHTDPKEGEYLSEEDELGDDFIGAGSKAHTLRQAYEKAKSRGMVSHIPEFAQVERFVMTSKSDVAVNGPTEVVLSPPMPFFLRNLFVTPAQELKIAPRWVLFLLRLFNWFRFPWLYREEWDSRRWYIMTVCPAGVLYQRLHRKAQTLALADCWVEGIEVNKTELLAGPRMHSTQLSPVNMGPMFSGPVCQPGESIKVKLNGSGGHVLVTALGDARRVA